MEVYKVKKAFSTNLNGTHEVGERFFKAKNDVVPNTYIYYPERGCYPLLDREFNIEDFLELTEQTNHTKEYYINKIYTQVQVDEILDNQKQNTMNKDVNIEKVIKEFDKADVEGQIAAFRKVKDHVHKNVTERQKQLEENANRLQGIAEEINKNSA